MVGRRLKELVSIPLGRLCLNGKSTFLLLQILADKLVCKEEGDQGKDMLPTGTIDLKYSAWMYRHHRLLQKQGQLNSAPDGCNPEAGRSLGSTLISSEHEVCLHFNAIVHLRLWHVLRRKVAFCRVAYETI